MSVTNVETNSQPDRPNRLSSASNSSDSRIPPLNPLVFTLMDLYSQYCMV